jgi:hypothetical protein
MNSCLPFGLCTAPSVFTKLLKPVMAHLRKLGLMSIFYIDDILCIGCTYKECEANVRYTVSLLQSLGFIINDEKSKLVPSQRCQYLGFIFDTRYMVIDLPSQKRLATYKLLARIRPHRTYKIRYLAQVIGTLISCCPAVEYGLLYTKELERHKFLMLQKHNGDFDAKITIPEMLFSDIQWWLTAIKDHNHPILPNKFKVKIYSDASKSGWGAHCASGKTHGWWTDSESQLHINQLELLAALYGLQCFTRNLFEEQILLKIDNTTAISYINRMGGIQFPHLHKVAKVWCMYIE